MPNVNVNASLLAAGHKCLPGIRTEVVPSPVRASSWQAPQQRTFRAAHESRDTTPTVVSCRFFHLTLTVTRSSPP
ncbi:hypothetical protein BAUCODRAFT_35119 [Baudoinia panamericana UAMH 10762]|uniref:Uncharacterized protein n=1 Tax=Baudoinia panamericana (strain UAMH 10762) TaxID=717646 RepID=M2MU88_BAUPA|nr:uncharacterized protein BAUCODRAFT_35119 [Baudoinia panamericana UAMH 10762]EMC95128.1 hypothetical protein BAUCODRAFT_35119 [Baudoinia panamericana UAMH 10762]